MWFVFVPLGSGPVAVSDMVLARFEADGAVRSSPDGVLPSYTGPGEDALGLHLVQPPDPWRLVDPDGGQPVCVCPSCWPVAESALRRVGPLAVRQLVPRPRWANCAVCDVLPPGFHRIWHYGFLANRNRQQKLTECRRLLHAPPLPEAEHAGPATTDYRDRYEVLTGRSLRRCPCCHDGNMHPVDGLADEWAAPAIQDSS